MELSDSSNLQQHDVAEPIEKVVETTIVAEEQGHPAKTVESILENLREIAAGKLDDVNSEDLARIKQQFYMRHTADINRQREQFLAEGNDIEAFVPGVTEQETEFKQLMTQIKEAKARKREEEEAQREANLARKRAIIAEFTLMAGDTDNVNRHHQRARELQAEFRSLGEVPPQYATEVWKQYQEAVELFYDQAKINKELYDYDLKKNLAEKQLLIEEARKLVDEEDVILAFRRLQDLHAKWREIGPVVKELREDVWNTFKESSTHINSRYQAYFEERKAKEAENETAKTALCEVVEAEDTASLTSYKLWDEATKRMLEAQEKWRTLGFASKKVNNQLFARFRAACDKFFAAKAAFYQSVRDGLNENLAKKIALCEQAEALKESEDWVKTAESITALQRRWKEIGAVGRKQSDAVWTRFQSACDYFFDRKKRATSETRNAERANLEAKRALVEELRALDAEGVETDAQAVHAAIRDVQTRWKEIGHVPFREKDKVYEELRGVIDALYERYDLRGQRGRMNSFRDAVARMGNDGKVMDKERERLVRQLEQRKNELQTYENNLGFLSSKSSKGNSMVKEMERRVERFKADIAELVEKIKLLDNKE